MRPCLESWLSLSLMMMVMMMMVMMMGTAPKTIPTTTITIMQSMTVTAESIYYSRIVLMMKTAIWNEDAAHPDAVMLLRFSRSLPEDNFVPCQNHLS